MAARLPSYWKMLLNRSAGGRNFTSSTAPRLKAYAATPQDVLHPDDRKSRLPKLKGEYFPIYVVLGMIAVSVSLGLATAKLQLLYSPNVYVSKKRRETVPEVTDPDYVVEESDKLIRKSIFRRLAHVQELGEDRLIPDPIHGNAITVPKKAETLKSVGVDPARV